MRRLNRPSPIAISTAVRRQKAAATPEHGAAVVILATPLTVAANDFSVVEPDVEATIRSVCERVHGRRTPGTAVPPLRLNH